MAAPERAVSHGGAGMSRELGWSRHRFPDSLLSYGAWLAVLGFLAYSVHYLEVPLARIPDMLGRMGSILASRYYPPDVGYVLDRVSSLDIPIPDLMATRIG